MVSCWPSPVGNGFQAFLLNIFLKEKLLNFNPKVPIKPPCLPPQPAESSIWSADFSFTVYLMSTVPSEGFGIGSTFVSCASKNPKLAISLCERIKSERLNLSPG